jgi:hypothetical protein
MVPEQKQRGQPRALLANGLGRVDVRPLTISITALEAAHIFKIYDGTAIYLKDILNSDRPTDNKGVSDQTKGLPIPRVHP